ncbi:hypothetical protein GQ602_005733 [Ophiocordyceps camponoti-floridani]|uniref:Uncharacterized protein n=1 Tax=Ophiocordyceps camponoti-floridani TaxID=2030778 RepID=A0A8H4Q492_9HYPO|nr:hypothetical protein GQ602_005733 [Ophiocordyceps camponoti-floridani]
MNLPAFYAAALIAGIQREKIETMMENRPPKTTTAHKEQLYKQAMIKNDYNWAEAYALDPTVKDMSCAESDCPRVCRAAYGIERTGVWGFWLGFSTGECPRKRCWLDEDWSRKEDVLHWKMGGKKAVLDGLGNPTRDIVLLDGAFVVESLIFACKSVGMG